MDIFTNIWAILGFFAFISVLALQDKVSRLERRVRSLEDGEETALARTRADLSDRMPEYIGKCIVPEFYENEEDYDIGATVAAKNGSVTVIDCDDKWVLVRMDDGKTTQEKLLRINSINSIASITPNTTQQEKT